ncbi:DUF3991 domain-containing protein [Eubacterium sp. AF22-8LB]|uniref:toprim domain-containing protein n=1 Tax=Eubacterium sp. AF22-8LB TaxID=2292232 RepID=UPI000E54863D|nr:toprim domain-containing protein [Eubacterium sp. AF22-8LB]RGS30865.1 DUF3991 domain-containing protein [Eubacterium sp. AF22-8LB]
MNEYNNIRERFDTDRIIQQTANPSSLSAIEAQQKYNNNLKRSIVRSFVKDLESLEWDINESTDGSVLIVTEYDDESYFSYSDAFEAYRDTIVDDVYQGILDGEGYYNFYLDKEQIVFLGLEDEYNKQMEHAVEGVNMNLEDIDDSVNDILFANEYQPDVTENIVDPIDEADLNVETITESNVENVNDGQEHENDSISDSGEINQSRSDKSKSNDLKEIAKQIDLQMKIDDVAILCGLNLEKNGRFSLRDRDHDSLVFDLKRNFFFWNSQGKRGGCVKLYMEIMGVDFKNAVLKLMPHIDLDKEYVETVREKPAELSDNNRHLDLYNQLKELNFDTEENRSMRQSIAYLTKTRGLDKDIVNKMITEKMIYQISDKYGPKVAFVGRKDNMYISSVCQRSVSPKIKFKGDFKNCNYKVGWFYDPETNGRFGEKGNSNKPLLVFEANIDMISYMSLLKECGVDYTRFAYLSCSSINHDICIPETCKEYGYNTVRILFDNDYEGKENWGQNKAKEISSELSKTGIDAKPIIPDIPSCKDWNDIIVGYRNNTISLDTIKIHMLKDINDLVKSIPQTKDVPLTNMELNENDSLIKSISFLENKGIDLGIMSRLSKTNKGMFIDDKAETFIQTRTDLVPSNEKQLLVFESNIDMLSYMTLLKETGHNLAKYAFISDGNLNESKINGIKSFNDKYQFKGIAYMPSKGGNKNNSLSAMHIVSCLDSFNNNGMDVRYVSPAHADSWNERLNQYKEEKNKVQNHNVVIDKPQNKSVLQRMRDMSGNPVSIDELNRSVGQEKEMNKSR